MSEEKEKLSVEQIKNTLNILELSEEFLEWANSKGIKPNTLTGYLNSDFVNIILKVEDVEEEFGSRTKEFAQKIIDQDEKIKRMISALKEFSDEELLVEMGFLLEEDSLSADKAQEILDDIERGWDFDRLDAVKAFKTIAGRNKI